VAFTDTPELFGGELRILGAVDFADDKVLRWVDYWDAAGFDEKLYRTLRTKPEKFPVDFKEAIIGTNASPRMVTIATRLQQAFAAGDAPAAALLFSYDAVYEDMTLRAQLLGRAAIERYLGRVLSKAPFGTGSRLRHVVGSVPGGGFEWYGSPYTGVPGGITALALDQEGEVQRLTSVYDGRTFSAGDRRALVLLSAEG
jgi:hypothetical protein